MAFIIGDLRNVASLAKMNYMLQGVTLSMTT